MQKISYPDKKIDVILETLTGGESTILTDQYRRLIITNSGPSSVKIKTVHIFNGTDVEAEIINLAKNNKIILDYFIDKIKIESTNSKLIIISEY